MRYAVTEYAGNVMKEKEYEGTPQEISELINKQESPKVNVSVPDIKVSVDGEEAVRELEEYLKYGYRKRGVTS